MISDNVGAGTASVNDNTFINLQVLGNAPASGNTVIGISGSKAPRNTFIQCDFENVQEVMNMTSDCVNNMFQSCNDWGSVSLTDASTSSVYVNVAGSGLFAAKDTL